MLEQIRIADCPLTIGGVDDFVEMALTRLEEGLPTSELSLNALKVVAAAEDDAVRAALDAVDVVGCDGVPIRWLARLAEGRSTPRMNGTDLMDRLLLEADRRSLGVFLLGSTDQTLQAMTSQMGERHPGARVVGTCNGFDQFVGDAAVAASIAACSPDIVLVALPSPMKEAFVAGQHRAMGPAIIVAVGGSFEVYVGAVERAPAWMQRSGLEWFHRLLKEPRRLFVRYSVGNAKFFAISARAVVRARRGR